MLRFEFVSLYNSQLQKHKKSFGDNSVKLVLFCVDLDVVSFKHLAIATIDARTRAWQGIAKHCILRFKFLLPVLIVKQHKALEKSVTWGS